MSQEGLFTLFQMYTAKLLLEFRDLACSCWVKHFWKRGWSWKHIQCLNRAVPAGTFIITFLHSLSIPVNLWKLFCFNHKEYQTGKCLKIVFHEVQNGARINLIESQMLATSWNVKGVSLPCIIFALA